jgi:hypothetical protein
MRDLGAGPSGPLPQETAKDISHGGDDAGANGPPALTGAAAARLVAEQRARIGRRIKELQPTASTRGAERKAGVLLRTREKPKGGGDQRSNHRSRDETGEALSRLLNAG